MDWMTSREPEGAAREGVGSAFLWLVASAASSVLLVWLPILAGYTVRAEDDYRGGMIVGLSAPVWLTGLGVAAMTLRFIFRRSQSPGAKAIAALLGLMVYLPIVLIGLFVAACLSHIRLGN